MRYFVTIEDENGKKIEVEVVILDEEKYSYENYVREEIENIILNKHMSYLKNIRGGIFELNKNEMERKDRELLEAVSTIIIDANKGGIKNNIQDVEDEYLEKTKINEIDEKNLEKLPKTNRKRDNLRALFDYIEQYPIIEIKKTSAALGLSYNTVSTAVKKLVELGILKETTNASRNRVFAYEEYLKVLRKDT